MKSNIPVKRLIINIPQASAKRLEKNRRLIIQGNYIFWDVPKEIVLEIPDNVDDFEFDFKDESHSDSLQDENGQISQDAPLDGRIYYNFYVEFHNQTNTRVERIEVQP